MCTLISFLASFLSENYIIFTHVDEARKANLHGYKRNQEVHMACFYKLHLDVTVSFID